MKVLMGGGNSPPILPFSPMFHVEHEHLFDLRPFWSGIDWKASRNARGIFMQIFNNFSRVQFLIGRVACARARVCACACARVCERVGVGAREPISCFFVWSVLRAFLAVFGVFGVLVSPSIKKPAVAGLN